MLTTACSQAANGARMQLPSMISQSFPKYMGPFVTLKIARSACAPGSKNILGVPSGKQGSPMIRFESLSFSLVRPFVMSRKSVSRHSPFIRNIS